MLPEQWTGNNLQWEQWTENKKEARTLHGNTPYPPLIRDVNQYREYLLYNVISELLLVNVNEWLSWN